MTRNLIYYKKLTLLFISIENLSKVKMLIDCKGIIVKKLLDIIVNKNLFKDQMPIAKDLISIIYEMELIEE